MLSPDLNVTIERLPGGGSSNIIEVGYDEGTRTLEIVFSPGGVYRYGSVDPEYAAPLLVAGPAREAAIQKMGGRWSLGRYVQAMFVAQRDRFPVVKVGDEAPPVPAFGTFRARWIDAEGQVVRTDFFEWDPTTHGSAEIIRPEALISLVIDAPYFDLPTLNKHLDGHVEGAVVDRDTYVIVNEEGLLRGMEPAAHPDVMSLSARYGQWLVGPVVIVERTG